MHDKKELLKNIAGIALTAGLAITTQGSSSLVLGTLNGIVGGLANSYLDKIEFSKISKLFHDTDPSELNHDLQKLVVKAVEWSIKNIEILYKKGLTDKVQIKEVKNYTKKLLAEVHVLNGILAEKDDSIYKDIEHPENAEELLNIFDLKVEEFPIINPDKPYKEFFKKYFTSNLQLCFGELLKKESNRPALIAYQREIYQNIDKGLDKIINQNDRILEKLTESEEKKTYRQRNEEWKEVQEEVANTKLDRINPEFEASLNNQLAAISQNTELLIDMSGRIIDDLEKVKGVTKSFSKDLKQNWISKNKVWVFSFITIALLGIVGLLYVIKTSPFQMNVSLTKDRSISVHPDYPALSEVARIRFYFPEETKEKEVTFSNEIIINNLSNKLKGTQSKVELLDKYWKLSNDSITLKKGLINVNIRPNKALSEIKGRVQSRDGQVLLKDVLIKVDNLQTSTDEYGKFHLKVPIDLRRIKYILRIEKEGYTTKEVEYIAGSEMEIRL